MGEGRLGALERDILKALAPVEALQRDTIPGHLWGWPYREHWRQTARRWVWVYPEVPRPEWARRQAALSRALRTLQTKGLVRVADARVALTPAGRAWARKALTEQNPRAVYLTFHHGGEDVKS